MSIKLKIGDKVKIPKTKSTGVPLGHSNMVIIAKSMRQDFLYFKNKDGYVYSLGVSMDGIAGDHFTIDDIELYEEYKYTIEYCRNKDNKVAILINDITEIKICDDLLGLKYNHSFLYNFPKYVPLKISAADSQWNNDVWYENNGYDIIKASEFINNNKNTVMDKKLIGYKIKSEYLHSKKSILESIDCVDASDLGGGSIFQKGSILYDNACKLSVIDLWFEKVYKEREQTITLSNGQQVLLKMNTDYFVVEGIKVLVNDIKELIKPRFALGNRLNTWAITLVDFKINIGCWNDITYADLKLIIDTHSELNEK